MLESAIVLTMPSEYLTHPDFERREAFWLHAINRAMGSTTRAAITSPGRASENLGHVAPRMNPPGRRRRTISESRTLTQYDRHPK
jgi:membrane protein YqaA with SNARE-associated domain